MLPAVAALLLALGADAAGAQQPTPRPPTPAPVPAPRDTARAPGDTLPRPTTTDTVRTRRDSVTVGTPAPTPPPAAAARIDSTPGLRDSLPPNVRADSIQTPIAGAELPRETRASTPMRWTRDSIFTTGAITLADLLERVEGITVFRSGFLASAQRVAYLGDFRRLRVFRDGIELDAFEPPSADAIADTTTRRLRGSGIFDPLALELWQADEVAIERTAGEVRVHVRTWSTTNTTAYTRVDVATGDEDTNQYRGFYGKRWGNGLALQVGAQQLGTGSRNRLGGGGDATNPIARLGWARGAWSVDAFYSRLDRTRNETVSLDEEPLLPRFESRRQEGYLRAAYGDPARGGLWAQALASSLSSVVEGTSRDTTILNPDPEAESDSLRIQIPNLAASRAQYVAAVGYSVGALSGSLTNRLRVFDGRTYNAPALRLAFERPRYGVSAFVERNGADSTDRIDLSARVWPLSWLGLQATASRSTERWDLEPIDPDGEGEAPPEVPGQRDVQRDVRQLDVVVRLGRLFVSGGWVQRGSSILVSPRVFANLPFDDEDRIEPEVSGVIATARGRFYKDAYLDVVGTVWDAPGIYRPRLHTRAELGIATNWLSRFPSGNLGIRAAIVDEYRSRTPFVLANTDEPLSTAEACRLAESACAPASNTLTGLLEIRIMRGVLWYQLRNALNRRYEQVPGLLMPRPINVYGVRWEFWG